MTKHILMQYNDALARINILKHSIERIEGKIYKINEQGYYVTDSVTRGKRGKKPLGTIVIAGFPYTEYDRLNETLRKRKKILLEEEEKLLELVTNVEKFIETIENIELRNIFYFYYVENLTWVKAAHKMNEFHKKKNFTADSCRRKHDRYLEKYKE